MKEDIKGFLKNLFKINCSIILDSKRLRPTAFDYSDGEIKIIKIKPPYFRDKYSIINLREQLLEYALKAQPKAVVLVFGIYFPRSESTIIKDNDQTKRKIGLCTTCRTADGDHFTMIGEIVEQNVINAKWYNKKDLDIIPIWTNGNQSLKIRRNIKKLFSKSVY